ncbi:Nop52-domain-containing protein [Rickenella mellea]|uniref:Nop52-domain-containing protein n=1 Tax=Rickenella mellea TaxID=50990 RepID=A0A4Y7QLD6_9AGAM|nr:Nop52-domain-containing protein [Rickenella mellea]
MSSPPLAKYLASTDKRTRDKAVKSLAAFLSDPTRDDLPETEMAKLWKGIFYCFWMSDKPLVQQALSTELADLVLAITSTSAALPFLRGFWVAIVREWNGIDRLRMDKYYMLVRKYINAGFRLLLRARWDKKTCLEYNSILTARSGGVLSPEDNRVPGSLTYHVCDVYLEELDKVFALHTDDSEDVPPAPLSILVDPFIHLAARTSSNITHQRIQSAVLIPLFNALSVPAPSSPDELAHRHTTDDYLSTNPTYHHLIGNACLQSPEEGKIRVDLLKKGLLQSMFDIASGPDTRDANRRKLYALWKSIMADEEEDEDMDPDAS